MVVVCEGNGWDIKSVEPFAEALGKGTAVGTDVSDWYFDFHIGGDSLDVSDDWTMLNQVKDYLARVGSAIRGVVLEENGHLHSVQRALGHARRSNRLQCMGDFIRADTPGESAGSKLQDLSARPISLWFGS